MSYINKLSMEGEAGRDKARRLSLQAGLDKEKAGGKRGKGAKGVEDQVDRDKVEGEVREEDVNDSRSNFSQDQDEGHGGDLGSPVGGRRRKQRRPSEK
jgi:hypothetical protein